MINIRRDILTPLSLLLFGWGASSCTSEDFKDQPAPGDGVPTLGISIGVSAPTRSASGSTSDFEPGSDLENYLDVAGNDYRIYFFDSDNKYIATFNPSRKAESSGTPTSVNGVDTYYYSFEGEVPAGVGTKFKLVVFANWGKYPEENDDASFQLKNGQTTLTELVTHADAQFNHLSNPGEGNWLSKEDHRLIPFYGVRYYDLSTFSDIKDFIKDDKLIGNVLVDLTSDKNALPLIRAMARVEVILNNKHASFSSVKMTKVNDKGFNSPYKSGDDWEFDYTDYFHNYEWDKDFVRGVHLVGGNNAPAGHDGSLEFKKVSGHSETTVEKWVAYVPEYQNIGVGDEYAAITVTLADPGSGTGEWGNHTNTIYFAPGGSLANNADGTAGTTKRYNIERNNIYRFTIDAMNANMECQLDVQPYAEQRLEVDLGLMRDESGDLMVLPNENLKPNEEGYLPTFFTQYMENHADKWPIYENGSTAVRLEPEVSGDYYAIRLGSDGDIKNAEVLLKDSDGCRVLTTFGAPDRSDNCSTREVQDYTTGTTYHKDKDGDQRLQHNNDHSSIALDHDKMMYYKTKPFDGTPDNPLTVYRYRVESWDPSAKTNPSGTFYYWKTISEPYTVTTEDEFKNMFEEILEEGEIPDEYRYLLNKDKDSEGNPTIDKKAVIIKLGKGDKKTPQTDDIADTILEEYSDEIEKILSSNSVYKVTN